MKSVPTWIDSLKPAQQHVFKSSSDRGKWQLLGEIRELGFTSWL